MPLIRSLSLRNFRCFRQAINIDLAQSTYLVGANNSGKTSLLAALSCFFDSSAFSPDYLNKTERAARKKDSLRSDITVTFDLTAVPAKERKRRLMDEYGDRLSIKKTFTWREASGTTAVAYQIQRRVYSQEALPKDVDALLSGVSISYIHPQEGADLLRKAQEKFKQRLFANWGRHVSVAEKLKAVQEQWEDLRKTANAYLSSTLTERLQQMWPESTTKVDLPERLEDIVAISDLTFRSSPTLPEVTLSQHGTGAQSAILYHTHYILDSDRTLHRGLYAPMWLLEEPESFMHADIAFQLGALLSSEEWLDDIQMVISTHSPIILAASRRAAEQAAWVVFEGHAVKSVLDVSKLAGTEIDEVGRLMGDSNFRFYFEAARAEPSVIIEDSRVATIEVLKKAGIPVARAANGVSEICRYVEVLAPLESSLTAPICFLVDGDRGFTDLKVTLTRIGAVESAEKNGWRTYSIGANVRVVVLPAGTAIESLFDEWYHELERIVNDVCDDGLALKSRIPISLSRLASELRKKRFTNRAELLSIVSAHQDSKDRFWKRVEDEGLLLSAEKLETMRKCIGLVAEDRKPPPIM